MKTLIKNHYSEPRVDSPRIMQYLREQNEKSSFYDILLIPIISVGILLIAFLYFLIDFNIEFLSTAVNLYYAVGGILFFSANLIIGILAFILEHKSMLMLFTCLIVGMQVWVFSYTRASFQRI